MSLVETLRAASKADVWIDGELYREAADRIEELEKNEEPRTDVFGAKELTYIVVMVALLGGLAGATFATLLL